jgi:hypothetical protein
MNPDNNKHIVENSITGSVFEKQTKFEYYNQIRGTNPAYSLNVDSSGVVATQAVYRQKVIFEGDSWTFSGGDTWPAYLISSSPYFGRFSQLNFAVPGEPTSSFVTSYAADIYPQRPTQVGDDYWLFVMGGVNDVITNIAGATAYANLSSVWASGKTDGFTTVAFTIPKLGSLTGSQETERLALNTLIRSDVSKFNYLVDIDSVFDYTVDPSVWANATHLSGAGFSILAKFVEEVINAKPYTLSSAGAVSEATNIFSTRLNGPVILKNLTTTQRDNLRYPVSGMEIFNTTNNRVEYFNGASWTAPGGGHTIQDEGTPITQRTNINFVGAGVTVTDGGAGPDSTIVTITSGGGSGDVVGPASAVDNRVAFFDGITGKLIKDSGLTLSGTNTGDQTSIVGINGTRAQFDTAVTDGNFLYSGDITQYTDELAQDAVGAMVDSTFVYTDLTPLLSRAALTGAITASSGSNTTTLGSFTKSQLDTAVSDGNVLYVGDVTSNATHTGDATGSGALTVVAINGTNLAALGTGLLKNTTTTGVPSIAVAGTDYLTPTGSAASLTSFPTFNQNTTGSAATLTTSRNIQGVAFNGSANIDIINGTGFVKATGTALSYDNSTYLTTSSAASTYQPLDTQLTSLATLTYPSNGGKFIRLNAGATDFEFAAIAGGGDALTSGTLEQFAATTSSQLRGVISDETGTGSLVFANTPTLIAPVLGVATATSINGVALTTVGVATKFLNETGTYTTPAGNSLDGTMFRLVGGYI